jgi:hypothetical protein
MQKVGKATAPMDPLSRLEMSHDKPIVLKNTIGYFHSLKATSIQIRCRPDGMTIYTKDGTGKILVFAQLDAKDLAFYYCEGEFQLGLNQDHIEGIFKVIDDSYFRIMFQQCRITPDILHIVLSDHELNKEDEYHVRVTNPTPDPKHAEMDKIFESRNESTIQFEVQNKHLKKSMEIVGKHAEQARFECVGSGPLTVQCSRRDLMVGCTERYNDSNKIKLVTTLKPTAIVQLPFLVSLVKKFADATASGFNTVKVFGSQGMPLVFVSELPSLKLCSVIELETI